VWLGSEAITFQHLRGSSGRQAKSRPGNRPELEIDLREHQITVLLELQQETWDLNIAGMMRFPERKGIVKLARGKYTT